MTGQVGKVYADAVFDLCLEEDTLEPIYKDLNACAAVFRKEPGLAQLLEVPTIPLEEKRALVEKGAVRTGRPDGADHGGLFRHHSPGHAGDTGHPAGAGGDVSPYRYAVLHRL